MAVRQAAAARWAVRRANEGRMSEQSGEDAQASPSRNGLPAAGRRQQRMPSGSLAMPQGLWDHCGSQDPFGMIPPGYPGMYPPTYPGMYPPWLYGMGGGHPGMMMPPMYGMGSAFPESANEAAGLVNVSRQKSGSGKAAGKDVGQKTKSRGNKKGAQQDPSSPSDLDGERSCSGGAAGNVARAQEAPYAASLREVLPKVLAAAHDSKGCQFLKAELEGAAPAERQAVFEALLPEACRLSVSACGNQVVQKLLEVGTADQKKALVAELQRDLTRRSLDAHGCRVVQMMLEVANREALLQIAAELDQSVIQCIESMHGNHVIQKCVEHMPPESVSFIVKAIEEQTLAMASHMYGCRVVQRLLEHCAPHQLERMLELILESVGRLAQDPYGNYVVQHILQHGRKEDKRRIIDAIAGNFVNFSRHKCSSNVVDKCLEVSTIGEHAQALEKERAALMKAVIDETGENSMDGKPPLLQLVDDRFGNHIAHRVVERSRGAERELLIQQLADAEQHLRSTVKGRKLLLLLHKEQSRGRVDS